MQVPSIREQIHNAVRGGAMTVTEVAEQVQVTPDRARHYLHSLARTGEINLVYCKGLILVDAGDLDAYAAEWDAMANEQARMVLARQNSKPKPRRRLGRSGSRRA